jgi:hypothetical protein
VFASPDGVLWAAPFDLSRRSVTAAPVQIARGVSLTGTALAQLARRAQWHRGLHSGGAALDLPGHGHSDIPAAEYTADFFIETIAGFLQQLEIEKAVLVGESIGATAALGLDGRRRSPASSSRSTRCPRSAER